MPAGASDKTAMLAMLETCLYRCGEVDHTSGEGIQVCDKMQARWDAGPEAAAADIKALYPSWLSAVQTITTQPCSRQNSLQQDTSFQCKAT